jgi:formamidopyrimidine-DNA glycosylase
VPELPEVETIRRHLAPHVEGRTLRELEVLDERWTRPLAPAELAAAVAGRRIDRLSRRGKYLVWELEDDVFLLMHLRMTGNLLLDPRGAPPYTRAWLRLTGRDVAFADQRRFGTAELALGPDALDAFFATRLGVEPLGEEFTAAHLHALARTSRAPIKAFLLDQKRIAGVGNIYADEALFRARIHPLRPANRLNRPQAQALRDAVVASLTAGIAAKGATIDDFRDPDGASGAFQDQFLVHRREGEPCPRCGGIVRKLRAAGRGTYVCERCQPKPRRRSAVVSSARSAPATDAARDGVPADRDGAPARDPRYAAASAMSARRPARSA